MPSFGSLIRQRREAEGISQKDLAGSLGVSASYLHDLETDRRGPPPDELLEKIAHALGHNLEYIYTIAGRLPPDLYRYLLEDHPVLGTMLYHYWRNELKPDHDNYKSMKSKEG